MYSDVLRDEEKIGYVLRTQYSRMGYRQYKMSKFEEYDFYAQNKDFLVSDAIITFTDTNGRLMALKPDVTLSIVKSSKAVKEPLYKVYYDENVYRISGISHRFKEILQTGLECIGDVNDDCIDEVLGLAASSLKAISEDSVLTISHQGIIADMVKRLELAPSGEKKVYKCIADKNVRGISDIRGGRDAERLKRLVATGGTAEEVIPVLRELECDTAYISQMEKFIGLLGARGYGDMVRIDFSLVNDMAYYNGIVFKGFVKGIPFSVLSGGQYDRLLQKMGRKGGAIGFAVYLDMLEYLPDGSLSSNVEITGVDTDSARAGDAGINGTRTGDADTDSARAGDAGINGTRTGDDGINGARTGDAGINGTRTGDAGINGTRTGGTGTSEVEP